MKIQNDKTFLKLVKSVKIHIQCFLELQDETELVLYLKILQIVKYYSRKIKTNRKQLEKF